MKILNKLGSGVLSLFTLFIYSVSSGFPKSRIASSVKHMIGSSELDLDGKPESLILQPAGPHDNAEVVSNNSHRSHSSHKSHSSGTSGRVKTTTGTQRTTPPPTTTPKTATVPPAPVPPAPPTAPYSSYFTINDLERLTGYTRIQQKAEASIVYFYTELNENILQIKYLPKDFFEYYRNDNTYKAVGGIGEAAVIGPSPISNQIFFLSGQYCVAINSYLNSDGKSIIKPDQLAAIAQLISSRL